jgi:acyl-coenzyme A thioesterase PaaI-like protein
MTLLDRTVGVNCRAASMGEPMATASLTVNFLQRVRVGERIEFRCHLRRKGRKTWFADAEAWVDDRLVATATGLWLKLG